MPGVFDPRPAPRSHLPAVIGTLVVVAAAPVFALAHWRMAAWGLAAALAGGADRAGCPRLPLGISSLAASGAVAFGRMFRAVAVMGTLIAVTVSDSRLGLPAVAVYVLAYTVEFGSSLVTYFGGEART